MSFRELLTNACKAKTFLSVYANKHDQDKFSCGYILGVSEDLLLIKSVSSNVQWDGYEIRRVNEVVMLQRDGSYERDLVKGLSAIDEPDDLEFIKPILRSLKMKDALEVLKKNNVFFNLYYGDPEYKYFARVISVSEEIVELGLLDEEADDNGYAAILISGITGIDIVCG